MGPYDAWELVGPEEAVEAVGLRCPSFYPCVCRFGANRVWPLVEGGPGADQGLLAVELVVRAAVLCSKDASRVGILHRVRIWTSCKVGIPFR